MKKLCFALGVLAVAGPALAVSPDVRIAQVYAGGGSTVAGTPYRRDYVVLFNNSANPVNIGGWALLGAISTANWGGVAGLRYEFPVNTQIPACSYLLVVCGPNGSVGADLTGDLNTSTTVLSLTFNFKVGLFTTLSGNANVACGAEAPGTLVDKVAWGSANCAEGTALAALTATTAAERLNGGATDTDDNSLDFTTVAGPVPNNSSTPPRDCTTVAADPSTWGAFKTIYR